VIVRYEIDGKNLKMVTDPLTMESTFFIDGLPATGIEYDLVFIPYAEALQAEEDERIEQINTRSLSGWPMASGARGFIDQPGELERHRAADQANGINCEYSEPRAGCRKRIFASQKDATKFDKTNDLQDWS